jgi:hypothetical protein
MRLLRVPLALLALAGALALVATGCAASDEAAGSVPESAQLAPADALGFVTVVTDESSEQWERADRLLGVFPSLRNQALDAARSALADEGLTWEEDVAPALGDEVVVVVTAGQRPVVLLQPESEERLAALIRGSEEPIVQGEVSGWTALAERQSDIDAYRTALGRGTLEDEGAFTEAMTALPADALGRGWVDLGALSGEIADALEGSGAKGELGIDWLAAAVSAEEDGLQVSLGIRSPESNGSSYEPKLLERVPADAVAALSFGGTQGVLDRLQGSIDVDAISQQIEDTVGVSLEGVLDALSGEGMLYVREGGDFPEITLVLAPPDVDGAFEDVDTIVRRLAKQAGTQVRSRAEGDLTVYELEAEGVRVAYTKVDADAVLVTTGADAISEFRGDGPKLADSDAFTRAAEQVGLGERTRGFAYVDIDGLVPFVECFSGADDALPSEARDALAKLDSFVLQASGDGNVTRLQGFLRVSE